MVAILRWSIIALGRIVALVGSIQFAIPVFILVGAVLAWGSHLETAQSAGISRANVYGSRWFFGLIGLICASLICAVITRFPWKQRHVGFITVHTGLITLIAGGFWSLSGRIEGHMVLEQGMASRLIETDDATVELSETSQGKSLILAATRFSPRNTSLVLGDLSFKVKEYWEHTDEQEFVADDGAAPRRATEISFAATETSGEWFLEDAGGRDRIVDRLQIRVLPDNSTWEAPRQATNSTAGYFFTLGDKRFEIKATDSAFIPGWQVISVKEFAHAVVSGGTLSEGNASHDNPAVEVQISDGNGTLERHVCFQQSPDMIMIKRLAGTGASGARLTFAAPVPHTEQLVVFGAAGKPRLGYVGRDGHGIEIASNGTFPMRLDAGRRTVTVLRDISHAQLARHFVRATENGPSRPALVLHCIESGAPIVIAWKSSTTTKMGNRILTIRFGPGLAELPFTLRLKQFRKTNYPGTTVALEYQSDVLISAADGGEIPFMIHMNTPYSQGSWRVYQSGFLGDSVSVFNVMKDPGLPLTYAGATVLCIGIVITFFGRRWSTGHPGVSTSPRQTMRQASESATTQSVS